MRQRWTKYFAFFSFIGLMSLDFSAESLLLAKSGDFHVIYQNAGTLHQYVDNDWADPHVYPVFEKTKVFIKTHQLPTRVDFEELKFGDIVEVKTYDEALCEKTKIIFFDMKLKHYEDCTWTLSISGGDPRFFPPIL
jgi:hypothetical protein